MQLASLTFVMLILPALLLIYYIIPKKIRQGYLILSGFLLYSWGNPARVLYPAAFLFYDYGVGLLLEKCRDRKILCRIILFGSVILQGTAMIWIRYTAEKNAFFPFGITIYTLQGLGYLIGVYQKRHRAAVNFCSLGLYLMMFPSLFAGSLFSYEDFAEQKQYKYLHVVFLGDGLSIFVRGLAEKVVLADTFGYIFGELQQIDPQNMSLLTAWLTTIVFSMYLYFELLGYAEMARGLGKCFGYDLPKNFHHPFFASGIEAFMQSWNITLASWFERNFSKVLKSKKNGLNYAVFLFMWMLMGLWYGIGIQFLLWGLAIGILLLFEKTFLKALIQKNYVFGMIYTGILPQFLWVLFFTENLTETACYWKSMIGFGNGIFDSTGIYFLVSYIPLILVGAYIATDLFGNIAERLTESEAGQKLTAVTPIFHGILFIFCLASMLYGERSEELLLWL